MPSGLCNAPATFERLMETVLAGLNWQICLIYLNDIIVIGKDFEEMIRRLDEVLQKLHDRKEFELTQRRYKLLIIDQNLGHSMMYVHF